MRESASPRNKNRLARETSPYLRQHATNPVDWYPWGDEALKKAATEDKPIFLSIGYSACHWCHVMERESFESEEIANYLNAHFVSIKVDREERPDLDEVYMKAVQLMTGSGGWPMSVFLTPDRRPFYGGTYFPPRDAHGRPGFLSVLSYLAGIWKDQRGKAVESADMLVKHVQEMGKASAPPMPVSQGTVDRCLDALESFFDRTHGGFGGAPKFPHPMDLRFLLAASKRGKDRVRPLIELSLDKMAKGGIYDQLGGGFHRYATDERWLVPHFEKMLYDNALLAPIYAEASHAFRSPIHERIARETCNYVLREMRAPEGGFYSATDADSEGEEGKFFVWTKREILEHLGEIEGNEFARFFGVTEGGNFEHGTNLLEQIGSESDRARHRAAIKNLLAVRASRVPPARDDKILVEWNGLMIGALARVGAILHENDYVAAAERAADFILEKMRTPSGLLRTFCQDEARIDAFLSDYANLIHGLLELCAVSPDRKYFDHAIELTNEVRRRFAAPEGGFYATSPTHETLIVRSRDPYDNATPSGNSVMATNLLRLADWTGDANLHEEARKTIEAFAPMIEDAPAGFGWMLQAVDRLLHEPTAVVIVAPRGSHEAGTFTAAATRRFHPDVFVLRTDGTRANDPDAPAILKGRSAPDGKAAAYVCRGGTCLLPPADPVALEQALDAIAT